MAAVEVVAPNKMQGRRDHLHSLLLTETTKTNTTSRCRRVHRRRSRRRRLIATFVSAALPFLLLVFFPSTIRASSVDDPSPASTCRDDAPADADAEEATIMSDSPPTKVSYEQDGPEAREIAEHLPYFPFKGIPRFYDIGGFLYEPAVFQRIVDIFAARYAEIGIDSIAGLDARGFILGPPIALALKKPFLMMRKAGKMPNTLSSAEYETEYGSRSGLTVQRDKIKEGDRVLIIDDLVATGGTLSSAITLVHALGGTVVECACVVELKMFVNPSEESGLPSRTKMFTKLGIESVPVWGLISEDVLTVEAELPEGYVDDGEEH